MLKALILMFNVYELILLSIAITGVLYDFCRTTVSTRSTSSDF